MIKKLLILIVILTSLVTKAQEKPPLVIQNGDASPYSFFGIGTLNFRGTAENRTMGGLSILSDSIHTNLSNPAAYADLKLVNYTIGFNHKELSLKTKSQSESTSVTGLNYLAISIPMGKFGAGFGLLPVTSVGYALESKADEVTRRNTGEGGLNKVFLALGYNLFKGFNIGIDASYNFGKITNRALRIDEGVQFDTQELNESDLVGFSFNFGAMYKTMISSQLQFSSAISYSPSTDLSSKNTRALQTVDFVNFGSIRVTNSIDVDVPDTDITFPSQLSVGFGIGKPRNWFVGAEFVNKQISGNNRSLDLFNLSENVVFDDITMYKLGGYYIPKYDSFSNYWSRVTYRAGIRFENLGMTINNEEINEFGISFGVGLPVRNFSNVNIGFEIGRRGTKNAGLVEETFFGGFISLSLNSKWFKKTLFD
ncbi:MAG: hypothetical protein JKZ03_04330 [Flavobacteriaceae bacterium]|nr:hypothetical protein [Flavobacteriaceae bacterium]